MEPWPYKYFSKSEIKCKCGECDLIVNHDFVSRLDALREMIGRPIILLSANRCALHNARIGGAPLSKHIDGVAADISLKGQDPIKLLTASIACGFSGIGFAQTFLHLDTGRLRSWDYGKRSRRKWWKLLHLERESGLERRGEFLALLGRQ